MEDESCETAFKGKPLDSDGVSKKRALSDGNRAHDGKGRQADHGPHGMGVIEPKNP